MDYFAEFCIWISNLGIGQKVYMSFHYLSIAAATVLFIWLAKKMKIERSRTLVALLVDCVIFYSMMMIIGWAESGFDSFGKRNLVTVFIWGPAVFLVGSKISRISYMDLCVMSAPALPLIHGVSRPGCMIVGCCRGFESSWGIYNVQDKIYRFPIQAIEMLLAFAVVGVLLYILKRWKYQPVRWLYPFMLVTYGAIQFACDFLRVNEKIYLGSSLRGLHALSMVIVGGVWLGILWYNKEKKKVRRKS